MTFDDLFHSFSSAGLLVTPSEIHGMLCGRITMGESLHADELMRVAAEYLDRDDVEDVETELHNLYQLTLEHIRHEGFEFQLLLPDDELAIGQRTEALATWCNGFLYGLSQAGLDNSTALSEESVESLNDLSSIAKLHSEDADDDDEMSFFELVEFVRVVVIMLHTEFNPQPAPKQRTLH